jgi:predicted PP-loop superfamily ATPase
VRWSVAVGASTASREATTSSAIPTIAMVVCESREEAVQWKRALDQEIERHGHTDVKTLVAFSGGVTVRNPEADDIGMDYTEPG